MDTFDDVDKILQASSGEVDAEIDQAFGAQTRVAVDVAQAMADAVKIIISRIPQDSHRNAVVHALFRAAGLTADSD